MEVKILTLTLFFVLYQTIVSQVIRPPVTNNNYPSSASFNNLHRPPNQFFLNRPLHAVHPAQTINRLNWLTRFPNQFPFNNNRLNNGLTSFNLAMIPPMHNHMIDKPSQSQLGTSLLEEYLNQRTNKPNGSVAFTNPMTNWNNMNKPPNIWYRPHGTESMELFNHPSNKPCQSQATESSVVVLNPSTPTLHDQAVDVNPEHHENSNISNSKPPKEIQEDPVSDDSNPDIDIRGGFDG